MKTANIFLTEGDDRVKLGDFGISRLLSSQTELAATCVGTPYYLSPELISGQGYDGRTDVWSLGVLMYEFLVGSPPFEAQGHTETYKKIARVDIKWPAHVTPDARDLISKLLVKDPASRMKLEDVAKHPWIVKHTSS